YLAGWPPGRCYVPGRGRPGPCHSVAVLCIPNHWSWRREAPRCAWRRAGTASTDLGRRLWCGRRWHSVAVHLVEARSRQADSLPDVHYASGPGSERGQGAVRCRVVVGGRPGTAPTASTDVWSMNMRHRNRAQAMVEFGLIALLLVLLVFGIADF